MFNAVSHYCRATLSAIGYFEWSQINTKPIKYKDNEDCGLNKKEKYNTYFCISLNEYPSSQVSTKWAPCL